MLYLTEHSAPYGAEATCLARGLAALWGVATQPQDKAYLAQAVSILGKIAKPEDIPRYALSVFSTDKVYSQTSYAGSTTL